MRLISKKTETITNLYLDFLTLFDNIFYLIKGPFSSLLETPNETEAKI